MGAFIICRTWKSWQLPHAFLLTSNTQKHRLSEALTVFKHPPRKPMTQIHTCTNMHEWSNPQLGMAPEDYT